MKKETLILAYELGHVAEVVDFAEKNAGHEIIALDFWVEQALEEQNVPFRSLSVFAGLRRSSDEFPAVPLTIAREWYRLPQMQFFAYKGISIGEALEPMLATYFGRFLYYLSALEQVVDACGDVAELVVPFSKRFVSPTAGPLAAFEARVVVDAARTLAQARGIQLRTVGNEPDIPSRYLYPVSFSKRAVLALYNTFIRLAPRRSIRIFASEYWRHISPFIETMNDVELVLMDRSEAANIPISQLWKHRVQLVHPLDVVDESMRGAARREAEKFGKEWTSAKKAVAAMPDLSRGGIDWWPVVERAFDHVVQVYAERIVADIEALEKILLRGKFDKVLLRASVGGRLHHFFLIARIARRLGIPSIELQHAGETIDPRSLHSRLETDYLAAYGPYTRTLFARNGYVAERIVPIGSPRFDRYMTVRAASVSRGKILLKSLGVDLFRPVLLAAVPAENVQVGSFDSYDIAAFFRDVRALREEVEGLQVVFKFRSGGSTPLHRAYLTELFLKDMAITEKEYLFSLICASDAVISGNSTVIYETMLAERPLVLYPWKRFDTYHAEMFASAAPLVHSAKELVNIGKRVFEDSSYRQELLARGHRFLESYSFDGVSAERMSELLRRPLASRA